MVDALTKVVAITGEEWDRLHVEIERLRAALKQSKRDLQCITITLASMTFARDQAETARAALDTEGGGDG